VATSHKKKGRARGKPLTPSSARGPSFEFIQAALRARQEHERLAKLLATKRRRQERYREKQKRARELQAEFEAALEVDRQRREAEREARRERERARRKAIAQEARSRYVPRIDAAELLARARRKGSRGEAVRNVRAVRLKRGGFVIRGELRDGTRVRGYEIVSWDPTGAIERRTFFWGLASRVDSFSPYDFHEKYPREGELENAFFSAWQVDTEESEK